MSSKDYSALITRDRKLLPCQKNKVFLTNAYNPRSNPFGGDNVPDYYETYVLNSSPVQVSRNRFKADIVCENDSVTLYEGTRFVFNGKFYYLAQQVNLEPNVPVLDVLFETLESEIVQDGWTGELRHIIPYFSVSSIQQTEENEVIEDNVFSGGVAMQKALVGVKDSYELSGARVTNDPGYDVLFECKNTGRVFDIQFVNAFMDGVEEFSALCIGLDRIIDRGDFFKLKAIIVKLM